MRRLLSFWLVTCTVATTLVVANAAEAAAADPPLQNGDILVGTFDIGVTRIRGNTRTNWCNSPSGDVGQPDYFFRRPDDLIIDAQGRVVLLNTGDDGHPNSFSLWRCDAPGSTPTLLGNIGLGSLAGRYNPFPGVDVRRVAGLHLVRRKIFDGSSLHTQDLYAFAMLVGGNDGNSDRHTASFDPATGQWSYQLLAPPVKNPTDMVSASGYEISGGEGIQIVQQPISLEFQIGEFVGGLAFQQTYTVSSARIDEIGTPNVGTCPDVHDQYANDEPEVPGAKHGLAGSDALGWRDGAIITESGSIGNGWPFNHDIQIANIKGIVNQEPAYYFHDDYNCSVQPRLFFNGPEGFNSYNDGNGIPREVNLMSSDGTIGTQTNPGLDGRIVRVGGDPVQIIATNLHGPAGIETYPPHDPSSGGIAIIIKIESPVSVLITAPDGRKIGVDPTTGNPVNDFGADGWDSQTGEPHLYGVLNGPPGDYTVDTKGTGTGPYTITTFGMNLATDATTQVAFHGNATPGSSSEHEFSEAPTGTVTGGDTTAPTITLTTPSEGAAYSQGQVVNASYSCADDAGGSGLASCTGSVANGAPIDTSTPGSHTFTVNAADIAGNAATLSHTYSVADITAPTISITTPPNGASYSQGQVVNASYGCADEAGGSGLASCVGSVANGSPIDTSTSGSHTFTVNAADNAGHAVSKTHTYTVLDVRPPTVTITRPQDGATYALNQQVTAAYGCADEAGGSGIATCVGSVANGAMIDTSTLGAHSFSVTATDKAGHSTSRSAAYNVTRAGGSISITITTPSSGATFTRGQTVYASYSCTDAPGGGGITKCQGPVANGAAIDTSTTGGKTFTVNAADKAGTTATASATYQVVEPARRASRNQPQNPETVRNTPGGGGSCCAYVYSVPALAQLRSRSARLRCRHNRPSSAGPACRSRPPPWVTSPSAHRSGPFRAARSRSPSRTRFR